MNARKCSIEDCGRPHSGRGFCRMHLKRVQRHGDPHVAKIDRTPATDPTVYERLEDLRWMAETGESLHGAADRLGMTVKALEKFLSRHDTDLRAVLVARNPRDHNKVADGSGVTNLAATPAAVERAKRRRRVTQAARRRKGAAA